MDKQIDSQKLLDSTDKSAIILTAGVQSKGKKEARTIQEDHATKQNKCINIYNNSKDIYIKEKENF